MYLIWMLWIRANLLYGSGMPSYKLNDPCRQVVLCVMTIINQRMTHVGLKIYRWLSPIPSFHFCGTIFEIDRNVTHNKNGDFYVVCLKPERANTAMKGMASHDWFALSWFVVTLLCLVKACTNRDTFESIFEFNGNKNTSFHIVCLKPQRDGFIPKVELRDTLYIICSIALHDSGALLYYSHKQ